MVILVLIIDALALLVWGKMLHRMDRFNRDKRNEHYLFWFIVSGIVLNRILVALLYPLWEFFLYTATGLGYGQNPFVTHILIVGPVEETTKFLVFILLTGVFKSIKEPADAVVQAGSVALGFAIMENFSYGMEYGAVVLVMRSVISILGHVTYSGFWGLAWGSYRYSGSGGRTTTDRQLVVPFLLTAAFFHGTYNTLVVTGHFPAAILLNICTGSAFLYFYRYTVAKSPYRKFRLTEYKTAIPVLSTGLRRYPDSYVLNKRMGIFKIYVKKYREAAANFRKAVRIKKESLEAKYYLGASLFLSGETEKGVELMNSVNKELTPLQRKKMDARLKKVISSNTDREMLYRMYDPETGAFCGKPASAGFPKPTRRQKQGAGRRVYRGK